MNTLWPKLVKLLPSTQRPVRYINHEWDCTYKPEAPYRFCMVYPDTYELGQPNQAIRILCNVVNKIEGMAAERAYLPAPEFCDVLRAEGLPLFSLESCASLGEFDAVGITLSHELAATNVLETLDLAGITLHSAKRTEDEPLIIGGGPCTFNPEPYAPFFDLFVIGEAEGIIGEVLEIHRQSKAEGKSRLEVLKTLAGVAGCYVPALYSECDQQVAEAIGLWIKPLFPEVPEIIEKQIWEGFAASSAWEPCIVPYAEVIHDRLNIEVLRGCTRGCRFCQAGMVSRPVRERSAKNIVDSAVCGLAKTGYDEVSLTSLSTTDHSQIESMLKDLNQACDGKGIRISIPSQRIDAFGVDMAKLVAGQKKGGLTFAPEAGTQRLRDVINKNVNEEDLFASIEAAFSAGWRSCKLYFMIGLPTETDEDIEGIASLVQRAFEIGKNAVKPALRGAVKINVSCALFIPKPQTPFQWDGQIMAEEALRRVSLLRSCIKTRAIAVHWHDPATSLIEALLARGGRECASLIEEAWKRGARFDAWTEHFNAEAWEAASVALSLDMQERAQQSFEIGYPLAWNHISAGVSLDYLQEERLRATKAEATPDCSLEACTDCGVCSSLHTAMDMREVRRG